MNQGNPDVEVRFRKCRGTSDQTATILWIIEKVRELKKKKKKTSTSASLTRLTSLTVDHSKLWKILKGMRIPDHPACLLRNMYTGQETTVRTGHGTMNWFKVGEGVHQGCICHPPYLTYDAEYIMRNARMDEAQAGIKIAGRNINNLRHADDTTLMAESKESLLMKTKRRMKKLA